MKGNPKVLEELNKALREELTAINQYFVHAEMCENWGYEKLSEYIKKQSIGEMKHAESLLERIFFLDGTPTMEPMKLTIGTTVKQALESDLKLELSAVKSYNEAVCIAMEEKDNGSRDLFVVLLKDEVAPPLGGPVVEVCTVAKRDLKAGEVLDDYGMYMTYGEAVNVDEMSARQYLPEGLVEGCRLIRDIPKDGVITYADVVLPAGRLADRLRAEQYRHFRGETWLEKRLDQEVEGEESQPRPLATA